MPFNVYAVEIGLKSYIVCNKFQNMNTYGSSYQSMWNISIQLLG